MHQQLPDGSHNDFHLPMALQALILTTLYKVGKRGYPHFIAEASGGRIKTSIPLIRVQFQTCRQAYIRVGEPFSAKLRCFEQIFLASRRFPCQSQVSGLEHVAPAVILQHNSQLNLQILVLIVYFNDFLLCNSKGVSSCVFSEDYWQLCELFAVNLLQI